MECLLKALWLKGGNRLVENGKFKPVPKAGGHNLVQLACANGLSPSPVETDVLRRLSHFIEYGGRYPIPKEPSQLMLTSVPRGGKSAATSWTTPLDDQVYDSLVKKLAQLLG